MVAFVVYCIVDFKTKGVDLESCFSRTLVDMFVYMVMANQVFLEKEKYDVHEKHWPTDIGFRRTRNVSPTKTMTGSGEPL